ncbi:MAG: CBS domain-containing protein [Aeropyrum sp.]|nr:CBS domain-containing protein [Aeropyrum sp.]MCE4616670.1 CBS domain-containing protein [Aeropyrum sp.]
MYASYKAIDAAEKPHTSRPETPLKEVVKQMYENGSSASVIVDEYGRPIGIFTERDLVRVIATGGGLEDPVEKHMTKNPLTVGDKESLTKALAIMSQHRIRHLPVVDSEGRLVGIITAKSITEILKTYKEEVGEIE